MLGTKVKKHEFLWTARVGDCLILAYDFRGKYKKKSRKRG